MKLSISKVVNNMSFLNFVFDSIDAINSLSKTRKEIDSSKHIIQQLITDDIVTPEDFLKIYNLRMYDFENKSEDIKFMKTIDFQGAYIIHNHNKSKYYVGVADRVFRKLERIFNGYEQKQIYNDWKKGNKFTIRAVKLKDSGYSNNDELINALSKQYCTDIN